MKIVIISREDIDVSHGLEHLIEDYEDSTLEVLFPVIDQDFKELPQSVLNVCKEKEIKVTFVFATAEGIDEYLKQADDIVVTDSPVKEALRQIAPGDVLGMVWDDSPQAHFIVHAVEDLALDVFDIRDGLVPIETEELNDLFEDTDRLHDELISSMGRFVDLLATYVAATVMDSISQAVSEHIMNNADKKDINPFDER